jgi:hypothetical protein
MSGSDPIRVIDLAFRDNAGATRLDSADGWQARAVGVSDALNLVAEATGKPFTDMPATLPCQLTSRSPNLAGGAATLNGLRLDLSKQSDGGISTTFTLTRAWEDLPFRQVDAVNEVATVMRQGKDATAAVDFQAALSFVGRGFARQPGFIRDTSGSYQIGSDTGDSRATAEVPPAEMVFASGGLEVLEARIVGSSDIEVLAQPARALVRSPADVWFYSGHGLCTGELAIGPLDGTHTYLPWKDANDFIMQWQASGNKSRTTDMRILVINGCNVLNLDIACGAPGKLWAQLLIPRGGNLTHILGYAAKAPLDSGGGAEIAAQTGRAIRTGADLVKAWLDINANHRRFGAVAMDSKGYYAFDSKHKRITSALP